MHDNRAPKDFPQGVRNELLKEIAASGTSPCTTLYHAVQDGAGNWPMMVGLHYKTLLLARLDWIKANVPQPIPRDLEVARAVYQATYPLAAAAIQTGQRDTAPAIRIAREAYSFGLRDAQELAKE